MRKQVVILVSLAVLGIAVAIAAKNAASDDAHITMRVVRHALEGDGLRYNAGDMGVQPATSPLNLLLLLLISGALGIFGIATEAAVITAPCVLAAFALPMLGACAYMLMLGDKRSSLMAAAASAFLISVPISLGTMGLETILSMALCIGAVLAYRHNKLPLMGWLLGLAFLARHDAAILAVILYFLVWRNSKKSEPVNVLAAAIGFLAVAAPWLIFSLLYYGVATPSTLESKAAQGGTVYWPAWYPTMLWHWMKVYFLGSPVFAGLAIFAAAAGTLRAVWKRTRGSEAMLIFLAYQFLVFAAYSMMQMPDYHWYFVPYGMAIVVACGWLLASLEELRLSENTAAVASVAIVVAVGALMFPKAPTAGPVWESYREVGRYLEQHPPKTAAGLMEIGIIGFYAPSVRVFDFAGVATLEQAARVSQNSANTWLDDPSVADVVVIRGVDHPLEPDFDERFESLYKHEWTSAPSAAFSSGLQVWRLK